MTVDKMFSEVYAILKVIDDIYIKKTPADVMDTIKSKRDESYSPIIDANKGLDEQGISEDAIVFIFMLKRDYWCETQAEKDEVDAVFAENKEKWAMQLSGASSTRALLGMLHRR